MKPIFILVFVFILNLIQSIFTPIVDDEAYYWMWSRRLDLGYFDHPPMISWWIKLGTLFFDYELGARFMVVVLNTLAVYFAWKILLPESKKQALLFIIFYFSWFFINIYSFIATPDSPLLFFTLFYLLGLKRFLTEKSWLNTFWLGIAFAGLMYSKYHGLLVIIFTLLPLIKNLKTTMKFYIAVVISLVLYSPHFYWLYQNDFPPINYHLIERNTDSVFLWSKTTLFLLGALISGLGILSFHGYKALVKMEKHDSFDKALFFLTVSPIVFFLFSSMKVKPQIQWLLISYVAFGLIFYRYYKDQTNLLWIFRLGFLNLTLALCARISVMIPSFSPFQENKEFGISLTNIEERCVVFERYQEASIFNFYNPQHQGLIYRTIANRESQFTLWNEEDSLKDQSFIYVSRWNVTNDSIVGLGKHTYYLEKKIDYQPIHKVRARFLNTNIMNISTYQRVDMEVEIDLGSYEFRDLIQNNQFTFDIVKDVHYNLVQSFPIPIDNYVKSSHTDNTYLLKFSLLVSLKKGEYMGYVGVLPNRMPLKYISKPLMINVKTFDY